MGKISDQSTIQFKRDKTAPAELPRGVEAVLTVASGKGEGTAHKVTSTNFVIGRGDDVDLRLDDEGASRRHAAVVFKNHEFRVVDLNSQNGTLLNGSEVKEYALKGGDKITVGATVLRFTLTKW